ncbi:MAG: hypothetical protein IPH41_09810 [Sulfuritalea sp.]|nr:hypothetical protein [Sulfuritalea sp.]
MICTGVAGGIGAAGEDDVAAAVVVSVRLLAPPALAALPMVRSAPVLVRVTAPSVVVAVVTLSAPPPLWSNWMLPVPVVSVVAVTAVPRVLLMSRLPLLLSAVRVVAARFSAVLLPIPLAALRSPSRPSPARHR